MAQKPSLNFTDVDLKIELLIYDFGRWWPMARQFAQWPAISGEDEREKEKVRVNAKQRQGRWLALKKDELHTKRKELLR